MSKKIKYFIPLLTGLIPLQGNGGNNISYIPQTQKDIVEIFTSPPQTKEAQGVHAENFLAQEKKYKENSKENTKKPNTIEPPHEKIATMNFNNILALYGNEKGMQLIRKHFMIEINNKRIALGNKPLKLNSIINELAQAQAQKMADDQYFSHVDKDGNSATDRAIKDGRYDLQLYASNISYNISATRDVIQSYINNNKRKTGHYDVLSVGTYEDLGIGLAEKNGIWYVVLNYGKEFPEK